MDPPDGRFPELTAEAKRAEEEAAEAAARFGAFDKDRPGERMNRIRIDVGDIRGLGLEVELFVAGLLGIDEDDGAGPDAQRRRNGATEFVVRVGGRQHVVGRRQTGE